MAPQIRDLNYIYKFRKIYQSAPYFLEQLIWMFPFAVSSKFIRQFIPECSILSRAVNLDVSICSFIKVYPSIYTPEPKMAFKFCYVNLNINDLLKCKVDTNATGNFIYGKYSFNRVEIFGTLISIREFDEKNIYQIDDCTGVVACHKFNNKATAAFQDFGSEEELFQANFNLSTPESSLSNLEKMATRFESSKLNQSGTFKLGNFIQIRGQLKEHQGVRRVWVHFLKILEDPNLETFYMARQLELYKKVYDCNIDKEDA